MIPGGLLWFRRRRRCLPRVLHPHRRDRHVPPGQHPAVSARPGRLSQPPTPLTQPVRRRLRDHRARHRVPAGGCCWPSPLHDPRAPFLRVRRQRYGAPEPRKQEDQVGDVDPIWPIQDGRPIWPPQDGRRLCR